MARTPEHTHCRRLCASVIVLLLSTFLQTCVQAQVLSQWAIGEKGCGPCAVINSLTGSRNAKLLAALEGTREVEKARTFIRKYGNAQSRKYREHRTCYSEEHGTADLDLQFMVNSFLADNDAEAVDGIHVRRGRRERTRSYIRRIHSILSASIKADFHPVLSIRGLAAEKDDEQGKYVWNGKGGHWITVNSVSDITEDGQGFVLNFSDSLSGRKLSGFVHVERHRAAVVPMTFTVNDDGKEDWNWVSSQQCLMINAPGMPLGTTDTEWHQRAFTVLRYLIYREPGTPAETGRPLEITRGKLNSRH